MMNTEPVIDVLLRAMLTGDESKLDEIARQRSSECAHVRSLVCTHDPGGIDLSLGLGVLPNEYVVPFFEGPRGFFMSAQISLQTRLTGGQSRVPIDYSLSLDSNFAEKLRAFVNGENIQPEDRDSVISILMLRASNQSVQFDLLPFLIENARLVRDNPKNERPLNTLIAFRMLNHLDWDAFLREPGTLVFDTPKDVLKSSLRPKAATFLSEIYNGGAVRHHEAKSAATRALLLRLARVRHQAPKPVTVKHVLQELLRFCLQRLGFLPITELRLIWTGMTTADGSRFFGPITGKAKDMLDDIRSMAWDMTLLRVLELNATANQRGSFFLPYFVSIDHRWRYLLRLNPAHLMLVDDNNNRVVFGRTNEMTFQKVLGECMPTNLLSELTPEKIERRRQAAQAVQLDAMMQLVQEEEQAWLQGAS